MEVDGNPSDEEIEEFWQSLDREARWKIYRGILGKNNRFLESKVCTYCDTIISPPDSYFCPSDHLQCVN
jgi:hypothetical protein